CSRLYDVFPEKLLRYLTIIRG
ncbi:hypothetical protein V3C99_012106, partial [Haemonchus contortus]